MISNQGVLYIEPRAKPSTEPVIDGLTRKMTAAYRKCSIGQSWRGYHVCSCGAKSDNSDHVLPDGSLTNSLCIHYLAFHRDEIPESQIEKVRALDCGEEEPTSIELSAPRQDAGSRRCEARSYLG